MLACDQALVRVGDVLRRTGDRQLVVECFTPETNTCPIAPVCLLPRRLSEATQAFLGVLDRYTVADVSTNRAALGAVLGFV